MILYIRSPTGRYLTFNGTAKAVREKILEVDKDNPTATYQISNTEFVLLILKRKEKEIKIRNRYYKNNSKYKEN